MRLWIALRRIAVRGLRIRRVLLRLARIGSSGHNHSSRAERISLRIP